VCARVGDGEGISAIVTTGEVRFLP